MERKFKVGDVIKYNKDTSPKSYKVIDMVVGEKEYKGNSFHGHILKDCYILYSELYGNYTLSFYYENLYSVVVWFEAEIKSISLSCPQCNGELKDHYSDWAGKDIKKCKACGWC